MSTDKRDRRLFSQGFLLILFGLVIASVSKFLPNPRMALATHLEALLLGMLLLLIGLLWHRFSLPTWTRNLLGWMPIVGAHASLYVHFFATVFPSGNRWMPIAAQGHVGTFLEEMIITAGILTIGVTMFISVAIALWGMLRDEPTV
jgi:(hydroxyamino)benzene mutase